MISSAESIKMNFAIFVEKKDIIVPVKTGAKIMIRLRKSLD